MRIAEIYSHLNGQEHILVHKPELWQVICTVVETVDAQACKTKVVHEQRMEGRLLYSSVELNRAFRTQFTDHGWKESRTSDWVPADQHLIRDTMQVAPALQKQAIIDTGHTPISSSNQTDFVKERIAVEVQFGKNALLPTICLSNIWHILWAT